jgi:plasmid stability protein
MPVQLVRKGRRDYKELKVKLARKAQSVCKDLLDHRVQRVLKVRLARKVLSVHKEQREQLVRKVLQEVSERLALLAQQVQRVRQERRVRRVHKDRQDQMELQRWVTTVPFMTLQLKLQSAWIQRAP